MGEHRAIDRCYWFEQQIRRQAYPNATALAHRFEVSTKTAARAIAFLRDRLGAPLEYDASRKGYRYTDDSFELPGCQVSQEELLAVLVARRVLAHTADGVVADAFRSLAGKLRVCLGGSDLSEAALEARLSSSWAGSAPCPPNIFRTVLEALLDDRVLELRYASPLSADTTCRQVEPHHLRHYLGSWVLTAWCRTRGDWRSFYLSRIEAAEPNGEAFEPRPPGEWRARLDGGFGVFQGEDLTSVTLRFTPFRAPWIREQLWHPAQTIDVLPDGRLDLTFAVADLREVTMKVLSFGADVEVVEPEELKRTVAEEVERMADAYRL